MKKIKIIILFGKSASGKDTIQKWIVDNIPNTRRTISCTTRAKRENEQEGIDYFFLNNEEFYTRVMNGSILEATHWDNEFYGTPIEGLEEDKINICVLDADGVAMMSQDPRLDVLAIYVSASDKTRLIRSLEREENPDIDKIIRRYYEDKERFDEDFEFPFRIFLNEANAKFDKLQDIISNFVQNI